MSAQPAYGTERFTLGSPRVGAYPYAIRREIFIDGPPSIFYDESTKDFVTWRGKWAEVETLGFFASREEAREFMVARERAA